MHLCIMQPYYFPYIGYFDLLNRADNWVVFDTVNYKPKTWMNRNRILHPSEGWQYISVPVYKHVGLGRLCDVLPVNLYAAKRRLIGQLDHYRTRRAPYYRETVGILERIFDADGIRTLTDLNVRATIEIARHLGIKTQYSFLSKMNLTLPDITHPGQWAMEISKALRASTYINLSGGVSIFSAEDWNKANIDLKFTMPSNFIYSCAPYEFTPNLSIIDCLMWNSVAKIHSHLQGIRLNFL